MIIIPDVRLLLVSRDDNTVLWSFVPGGLLLYGFLWQVAMERNHDLSGAIMEPG
jgi:hypothetical protein